MKKIFIFISMMVLCLLQSLNVWAAMDWEGTMPFNGYRVQNVQYSNSYLNTMTAEQKAQWSPSAEWWVCTTTNPTTVFYLKEENAPREFMFLEDGVCKWIRIFQSEDRVATDGSAWTSYTANSNVGTYTIDLRYYNYVPAGYRFLYIRAQGTDNVVTLNNNGSITDADRWRSVKISTSPQRFYLYNAAQGVFIKKGADNKAALTTDPEEATLMELNGSMYGQAMTLKFSGSSYYIYQNKGTQSANTTGSAFTIEPVNGGFYIHNNTDKERYMQANSATSLSFPKDGFTDVNRTWKFISEDEYNQKVALSLLPEHKCYDKIITCVNGQITPTSRTGVGAAPTTETSHNADMYVKAHGDYLHFKSAGEVFYSVHLPAAKYTITLWEVCAGSTYLNLYSTAGTDDNHKVQYGGQTYKRLSNGHLDFRGDATSGTNVPFFSNTKTINISTEADFIIGLEGATDAAFDQILIEADAPVFCKNCYQYLICYDLDATSGKVVSEWDVQAVLCDDANPQVTVPAPPTAPNGYDFGSWNTRSDLRGMEYNVGDVITLPTIYTDNYNAMSLYAHWLPKTINITLDKNTQGTTDGAATIEFETVVSKTYTGVTYPSGLHLKGYYNQATGGRKVMNVDGSLVAQVVGWTDRAGRWVKGQNCTLYAQYGNLYTITYESGDEGFLRVLDDMGNVLPSGTQVVEGTVVTLQARVNQAGHQVYQWNVNGNITETDCGLWPVTITSDTHIGVTYETRSTQECYNKITIQCEDNPISITSGNIKGDNTKASPSTLKIGMSVQYIQGWTGDGYVDFNNCGTTDYMFYTAMSIPQTGNYQITTYSANGGQKKFRLYKKTNYTALSQSSAEDAVLYGGYVYEITNNSTNLSSDYAETMTTKTISITNLAEGDYLIGLLGQQYAKFDRIEVTYTGSSASVFCYDKTPLLVNSLPWSQGSQLDYGDTVYVTPRALQGCVNRANIEVLGMTGDLFKVICVRAVGDTILMANNVTPGTITVDLDDDIRTHGFMVIGVVSVSLGQGNNVINGDTKSYDGIFVDGNTLYDANGIPFVMRGTNIAHVWFQSRTMTDLEAIASHGANTVRVVLGNGMAAGDNNEQWGPTPVSEVSEIIDKCEELGLVCVLEVHNTTGKDATNFLSAATDYWIRIKDALYGHESTVIINIGNEWMNGTGVPAWANAYKVEIARLRAAGLRHCLMVDANGYGQGASSVASDAAVEVLNSDPEKNVVFSLHMYQTSGGSDSNVRNNIDNSLGKGLCLVIGEYGWAHKNLTYAVAVMYQTIISYTNEKKIGALSWSWYGNGGGVEYLDMVNASNEFITQQATTIGGKINADWGQYVVDNSWHWSGSQSNTIYTNERVLQVRAIRPETDEQTYTVWSTKSPLNVSSAQLSVGPEHFSTAKVGDQIHVHATNVEGSSRGAILKTDLTAIQNNIAITEGDYHHTFTAASLAEAKANGLVIRGSGYSIESVELEAANCHMMRVAADTIRVTTPLAIGSDYRNTFDFGNWEHLLNFRTQAFDNIQVGNILRFRITPSDGYTWDDTRVAYRCYQGNATINGVTTVGDIDNDHTISSLGGAVPDRQGYVDIRITSEVLSRLRSHGLIVFGKNAKMHYFSVIGDTFVVPADSATLVPECGIDYLVIHQGGQVINKGDVKVFKQISYVRPSVGTYTYCSFDYETTKNYKGAGGTYHNRINQWYTFTTPFDVNAIQIYDEADDAYYDINPVWDNNGVNKAGSFYMEYLANENQEGNIRDYWTKIPRKYPSARVPYIILYSNEHGFGNYFETNPIVKYVYNVPDGQTLTISGRDNAYREMPEDAVKTFYLYENNTLYDISFEGYSAYILNGETNMFELVEDAVVHPFECYVQATSQFKAAYPAVAMRRLDMIHMDTNTATSLDILNAELMLGTPETRVYDVLGREYSVDHLPQGVVILVNNGQVMKIMLK